MSDLVKVLLGGKSPKDKNTAIRRKYIISEE